VVTLKPDVISGEGVGSNLTSTTGTNIDPPTIEITTASKILTLSGVDLNLTAGGTLGTATGINAGKVILLSGSNPGKLTLGGEDSILTWSGATRSIKDSTPAEVATLSGEEVEVGTASEDTGGQIGYISGTAQSDATISFSAASKTIDNTATID
jgi:hypothetical protein